MRSAGPQRLGAVLGAVRAEAAPATLLAAVQSVWSQVAGPAVSAQADPVAERDGVVTVACSGATWAQELDLLAPELLERLNEALAGGAGAAEPGRAASAGSWAVRRLRFTADAQRFA